MSNVIPFPTLSNPVLPKGYTPECPESPLFQFGPDKRQTELQRVVLELHDGVQGDDYYTELDHMLKHLLVQPWASRGALDEYIRAVKYKLVRRYPNKDWGYTLEECSRDDWEVEA